MAKRRTEGKREENNGSGKERETEMVAALEKIGEGENEARDVRKKKAKKKMGGGACPS